MREYSGLIARCLKLGCARRRGSWPQFPESPSRSDLASHRTRPLRHAHFVQQLCRRFSQFSVAHLRQIVVLRNGQVLRHEACDRAQICRWTVFPNPSKHLRSVVGPILGDSRDEFLTTEMRQFASLTVASTSISRLVG
jgi:hypothetical protein